MTPFTVQRFEYIDSLVVSEDDVFLKTWIQI